MMERFRGLIGIVLILGIAFLCSNNRKHINLRLVCSGLALQLLIAVLVLKVPVINQFFRFLGTGMHKLEGFAKQGASFVYGGIGAMAPDRRADLARLGMKALLCGTLASYLSATIAGILV